MELPKYAKSGGADLDLVAAEDTVIWPGETMQVSRSKFHRDMSYKCVHVAV